MLERFGGNAASEKSVSMALDWLAKHLDRSGGWTFGHSAVCRGECKGDGDFFKAVNGATALALLPFLGAGQTHLEGKYKATVLKGLNFLTSRMKLTPGELPHGSWHEEQGNMYSHGLASIVICEAYAMTAIPICCSQPNWLSTILFTRKIHAVAVGVTHPNKRAIRRSWLAVDGAQEWCHGQSHGASRNVPQSGFVLECNQR